MLIRHRFSVQVGSTLIPVVLLLSALWVSAGARGEVPLGTAFSYQGKLQIGGLLAGDSCDFEFSLWDDPVDTDPSAQIDVSKPMILELDGGEFTATLDFGSGAFTGEARYLQIAVCCPASTCMEPADLVVLSPRQELTPAPYAMQAPVAPWSGLTGVPAGFADGTDDVGPGDGHSLDAADGSPVDALFVDNSGNVGIGTTSPGDALDIGDGVTVANVAITNGGLCIDSDGACTSPGPGGLRVGPAGILGTNASGNNLLLIPTGGGDVGIGTDTPEDTVDVRGTVLVQDPPGVNGDSLMMKKTGAIDASNIRFSLSDRANGTEAWMYGWDGTTFRNFQEWDYANNAVRFPANGSTLFIDETNGRVGVGTAGPSNDLDVNGGVDFADALNFTGSNDEVVMSIAGTEFIRRMTSNGGVRIGADDSLVIGDGESPDTVSANVTMTAENTYISSDNDVTIYTDLQGGWANRDAFHFDDNGRMGIGTITPRTNLEINPPSGDAEFEMRKGGETTGWKFSAITSGEFSEHYLLIGADGGAGTTNIMSLLASAGGGVGIGTTSPASKLHVEGDLTFRLSGTSTTGAAALRTAGTMTFRKNNDNVADDGSWFRWYTDGSSIETMRIENGNEAAIKGDGTFSNNGLDFAEAFKVMEADLEAGEVVSLTVGQWEYARRSTQSYDPHLIGVVSTKPGFLCGMSFDAEDAADAEIVRQRDEARARGDDAEARALTEQLRSVVLETYRPIAMAGRVPCKVDGTYGAIHAGDRVTSSPTPGHAMKQVAPGPSIGIALEDWDNPERGKIIVLVQPGWYGEDMARSESAAGEGPVTVKADSKIPRSQTNARIAALEAQVAKLVALVGEER